MVDRLTDQQEKFVQELIRTDNQRAAYKEAYPKSKNWKDESVDSKASTLINKNEKVKARYNELKGKIMQAQEKKVIASAQEVLEEISLFAMGKKECPVTDMFGNTFNRKPMPLEQLKALEMLCKKYGLLTDKIEHSGHIDTTGKLDAILERMRAGPGDK